MGSQDRGYLQFTPAEIEVGVEYALRECDERLAPDTLLVLAMTAGPLVQKEHCPADHAADRALNVYVKDHGYIDPDRRRAYVKAVCKLLSERNPKTKARREKGLPPRYKSHRKDAA